MHLGFDVAPYFGVDDVFNALQLGRRYRRKMRKVETQAIRRNQRTLLGHMLTEHGAQRGMQQMRGRVIEHGRLAPLGIDRAVQGRA